jgi:hypothetical protein
MSENSDSVSKVKSLVDPQIKRQDRQSALVEVVSTVGSFIRNSWTEEPHSHHPDRNAASSFFLNDSFKYRTPCILATLSTKTSYPGS